MMEASKFFRLMEVPVCLDTPIQSFQVKDVNRVVALNRFAGSS
jgi:hypothetical protein